MGKLESGSLKGPIEHMRFYRRYVDEIFVILNNRTDVDFILNQFNDVQPLMHFTHEKEVNNYFHFLDVQLERRQTVFRAVRFIAI